ncbi:lipopolysaccharide biosynthesis protein [Aurantiacibacter aquimixticola]|uniref:Lipopolysaccharide biosynthesis protein n=1 Tax=Aurantiacibacter aquimixticola TaxID=1958945 RepID=A0A419RSI1_9SPHN|nr:oligosaccharide flippase family protein [Aurantiacibacter aquimixticola]RJY08740.1 hypothetical protein D6201_04645 [Aurantiacibacter aquimixticola]
MNWGKIGERAFSGASGDVFRGMATLTGGLVFGRIIGLIAIPILTRIYDPADFGVLSVYTALVMLVGPFMALRFPVAIPLPRSSRMAVSLVALCFGLISVIGALAAVTLYLAAPVLLPHFSMEALIPYWWLVAVGIMASASYETLSSWGTRKKDFKLIARTSVQQSLSSAVVKVGMGFLAAGPIGLLLGQILAIGGGLGTLAMRYTAEFRRVGQLRIGKAAKLYSSFALYRLPAQILLAAAIQSPVLFIAARYDAATAGQFGLALTLVAVPMTFLVRGLSQAFYGEVAAMGLKRVAEIREITRHTIKRLALTGAPFALALMLLGEEVAVILFGDRWAAAGRISELLSVYLFSGLVASPIMRLLDLLREQWLLLVINGSRLTIICAIFIALPEIGFDLYDTVLAYSCAMFLLQSVSVVTVLHRLNVHTQRRAASAS